MMKKGKHILPCFGHEKSRPDKKPAFPDMPQTSQKGGIADLPGKHQLLSQNRHFALTKGELDFLADLDAFYRDETLYVAVPMRCLPMEDVWFGIPTGADERSRLLEFIETSYFLLTCYQEPRTTAEVFRMALSRYGGPAQVIREDVAVFTASHLFIGLLKAT